MAQRSSFLQGFASGTDAGASAVAAEDREHALEQRMEEFEEDKKDRRRKLTLDEAMEKRMSDKEKRELLKDEQDRSDKAKREPYEIDKLKAEIVRDKSQASYYDRRGNEKESEVTQMAEKDRQFGQERRARMDEYKDAYWEHTMNPSEATQRRLSDAEMGLRRWDMIEKKLFSLSDKVMQPPKKRMKKTTEAEGANGVVTTTEEWDEPFTLVRDEDEEDEPGLPGPSSINYPDAGGQAPSGGEGGGAPSLSTRDGFLKMAMPSAVKAPAKTRDEFSSDDLRY